MVSDEIDLQSIFSVGDVVVLIDEDTICTWRQSSTVVIVYERRPIYWAGRDVWRVVDSISLPFFPARFEDACEASKAWVEAANEKAAREADEFPF